MGAEQNVARRRGGAASAGAQAAVSDRDFARFQALINKEAGIWLAPVKKALLVGRLARRIRELGVASYADYYQRVAEDERERTRMLDCICTNETHFFREPRHFEFLASRVFPAWREDADAGRRARRVRVWSAACSTGEEPFSLAMVLLQHCPADAGWSCSVFATDLSTRVLATARSATWSIDKADAIPPLLLKRYMLRGTDEQLGKMRAKPCLRDVVRFERLNLSIAPYPVEGRFDAIFCRNVLIYFQAAQRLHVVRSLLGHLAPGGYLFLGHAATVTGLSEELQNVSPNIYRKR